MTIAAAFFCMDGLVFCADTQETHDKYLKVSAPKIAIRPRGEAIIRNHDIRLVVSGAGDGPFIDKLIDLMWEEAELSSGQDPLVISHAVEDAIKTAHKDYGQICQPGFAPQADLLYGLWVKGMKRPSLFQASGAIVNQREEHQSIGSGKYMARYIMDRMSRKDFSIRQAELLGTYLLSQSIQYVDQCGGDSHVVVLANDGKIRRMDFREVALIEHHTRDLDRNLGYLTVASPDIDLTDDEFERQVTILTDSLRNYRKQYKEYLESVEAQKRKISAFYGES
jgi:20S proteasome alpha/beta subunit